MRTSQIETQPTFGIDFANVGCTRAREVGRLVFSFSSRGPLRRNRAHQRLCWRGSSRLGVFGGCERRLMSPCSPPSRNLWLISSSFSSVRAWASRDRYRDYGVCAQQLGRSRHCPSPNSTAASCLERLLTRVPPCVHRPIGEATQEATPAGLCGRAGGSGIHPGERREPSKRRRGACRARARRLEVHRARARTACGAAPLASDVE